MIMDKIIWRKDPDLAAIGGEVARLNRVYGVVTEQASCCTWSVMNVEHVVISAGREGTFPAARKAAGRGPMNLRDVCTHPESCLTAGLSPGWSALVVVLAVVALAAWMRWILRAAMRDTTPRPSLDELDHHHGLAAWREPGRFGRDGLRDGESLDEAVREGLRDQ